MAFELAIKQDELASCQLCHQSIASHLIISQGMHFCCHGCQAVFAILSARGEVDHYLENPLFLQAVHSGLISNPQLLEQIRLRSVDITNQDSQKFYFEIGDMWCPSCAEVIHLVLMQEKGIKNCLVDYATDMASIEIIPRYISKEQIFNRIKVLGYKPNLIEDRESKAVSKTLYLRFIIASFCAFNTMMFAYPLYAVHFDGEGDNTYGYIFAWLSFFISLPVVTYTGWPIFRHFWSGLCVGLIGMEALVTIGVVAAFGLSTFELFSGSTRVYFDSMTVIVAFVLLGKIIENKAKFSAKESLFRLNLSLPKRGRKLQSDNSFSFVSIKEIKIGDVIEVRMGEMIILDGIVKEGSGLCNEAFMTGEPLPIAKISGSSVVGGSLLQHGRLLVTITTAPEQSTLQCIVNIVEQQLSGKMNYKRPADAIVNWFVPIVLAIALLTIAMCFAFSITDDSKTVQQTAFFRAIAVLLISCPCAIGIAAPTAESALIHALAACGAIVRNRGCLQHLGNETAIVFDKTGTITQGKFSVLDGLESFSEIETQILKGMTANSNHPIAHAINLSIDKVSKSSLDLTNIEEFAGKGVRANFKGDLYLLGSDKFLSEMQAFITEFSAQEEKNDRNDGIITKVYFAKKGGDLKCLSLGDQLKTDAKAVLTTFGDVKTFLVSGDGKKCVDHVAKLCGFKDWLYQASPLHKQEFVQKLKNDGEIVLFVGDGINDSPALTCAHVGISVVTASDVSIQVSDILLTCQDLKNIPRIRKLSQKGSRIIKQNLFWAFFYNVLGIGLAAFGWLSPIFAAFAMTASSLIVVFNAKRIK